MPRLHYPECPQILKSTNFSEEYGFPPCEHRLNALASEFSNLSAEFTKQSERLQILEQHFAELQEAVNKQARSPFLQSKADDRLSLKYSVLSYNSTEVVRASVDGEYPAHTRVSSRVETPPRHQSREMVCAGSTIAERTLGRFFEYDREKTELRYLWEESLWDVSVFIGSAQLSIGGSLSTCACLVLYLLLVTLYITECWNTFTRSQFDEDSKRDFQLWRSTVGHDVNLRDVLTGESLVSKVCNDNFSSPYSNFQLIVVQQLKEYLEIRGFPIGLSAGYVMVSLALCLWLLTLTVEVRKILDLSSAFLGLEIGWRSCFLKDQFDESVFHLTTVSYGRFIFVCLTSMLRASIIFVLGWVGILFLTHTTDLQEMLLNAVGLEYVLNLDELLFAALLSKIPRAFRQRIAPIYHIQRFPHWNNHIQTIVFGATLAAVYYATMRFMLNPFTEVLVQNLDALCGGREHRSYDFVVLVDSIGIPWAAATPSADRIAQEDFLNTYAQHVISRVQQSSIESKLYLPKSSLWPKHRDNTGLFMQVPSADDLMRLATSSPNFGYPSDWSIVTQVQADALVGWQKEIEALSGQDLGSAPGTVYNFYIRYLLGDQNASCDQVPPHRCYQYGAQDSDVVFRQLCPHRCGCASPNTGSVSVTDSNLMPGCAKMNIRSKPFVQRLRTLSCQDTSRRAVFLEWVQGLGDVASMSQDGSMRDILIAAFDTGGCDAAVHIAVTPRTWICEESTLPAVCPQSCGCDPSMPWTDYHARNADFCPYSCGRAAVEPCMTVEVDYHNQSYGAGPWHGVPCIFPFSYKDRTYTNCSYEDWVGPWCAVTVDEAGYSLLWGDCDANC